MFERLVYMFIEFMRDYLCLCVGTTLLESRVFS
jgi:hypothetical protein